MRRKIAFFGFVFFFVQFVKAQSDSLLNTIEMAIVELQQDTTLQYANISFVVKNLEKDSVIASINPEKLLVPASTMKVITTATALELLSSFHTFKTEVYHDGYIDSNCVLHGNIYIKGKGDPTLGSRYFTKGNLLQDWAYKIANFGIDSITGGVIGDASYFDYDYVPSTWSWGDIGNYYGTGVSGLTILDNTLHFYFTSGKNKGDSTVVECVEPYTPDLKISNHVKAWDTKKDLAYIYGAPYEGLRVLKGKIPKNRQMFDVRGAMHEPAYVASFELKNQLIKIGVPVAKSATTHRRVAEEIPNYKVPKGKTILTQKSPPLSKIILYTNLYSNNLYAEHLLKHVGKAKYKTGNIFSSTLAVNNYWKEKGVFKTPIYISDGSGLSRYNAISATHLVDVLIYMRTQSKNSKTFYSSLPIAGKTGTLRTVGRKSIIQGNLRAKSGTMTRVKSYAGYVKAKSGEELCFAVIVNNYTCTNLQIKKKLEKLMIALGEYESN